LTMNYKFQKRINQCFYIKILCNLPRIESLTSSK
jgi:hypothetical protein